MMDIEQAILLDGCENSNELAVTSARNGRQVNMDGTPGTSSASPANVATNDRAPSSIQTPPQERIRKRDSMAEIVVEMGSPSPKRLKREASKQESSSQILPEAKSVPTPRVTRSRRATSGMVSIPASNARPGKQIWSSEFLLSNPKSKLVHCNLSTLISQQAWDMLSPEDQAECLSHLPPFDVITKDCRSGIESCGPSLKLREGFFEKNAALLDDLRTFQDDLSDGRFEPSFLKRAATAREKRLRGNFDQWKDDQFELWWGQNQKLAWGMLAGDTTRLRLTDMAKSGMLCEGDVWRYSRAFKGGITVKKELTCTKIDKISFSLTFNCPPGKDEYLRSGLTPMVVEGIENPTTLETRLLDEDGRVMKRPNGNAFKVIRVIRGSEDIGSLFDVRMSAFEKLHGPIA